MILPQPVALIGRGEKSPEPGMLQHMQQTGAVFMMGQNPELPVMPERPTLLDFFHYRFSDQNDCDVDPEQFTDIIGRHFKQPEDGLGFDNSPVAHMWRTMIWPHNFL
jgi:hypothetical protein